MNDWYDRLVSGLAAHGHRHASLKAGDGRLLVTEHGARGLALELPGLGGNLFWQPGAPVAGAAPSGAPDTAETSGGGGGTSGGAEKPSGGAEATSGGAGEPSGVGGDRLWIAPEIAWHWTDLDQARVDPTSGYHIPVVVDPGYFGIIEQDATGVMLDSRFDLTDTRDGKRAALYATRRFRVIDAPAHLPQGLLSASFAITNTLSFADGPTDAGVLAGCWDILQVPVGGTLVCPTTRRVEPTSYYEPFGDRHVQVADDHVSFLVDGRRRIKMGLPADAVTGRMGYYRRAGALSTLIIRVFGPLPGEPYADLPLSAPADQRQGHEAIQAYNDDGAFGGFGEMEHHDPCLIGGRGPTTRSGSCVTHALAGPDDAVRQAGRALLGVRLPPLEK